jgi:predicted alpha/beta-fold hydrolase
MPLLSQSDYQPPYWLKNPHFNTIYAALFRKVELTYERERLDTPDGDFIDLDWSVRGADRLIVVLHGLEGHAGRPYIKGTIRWFNHHGWDGVGMNFRGCSGEPNRQLHSYHLGASGDLQLVLDHIFALDRYRQIVLMGYSLGGNVVLKYLGEQGANLSPVIRSGIAISVPCDVASCNREINRWHNWLYRWQFMKTMNEKILEKSKAHPEFEALPQGRKARNFNEYDEWYTAPIHGFEGAADYWQKTSCLQFIPAIQVPTLLVNALDDTFLSQQSYPYNHAKELGHFFLETPRYGGHVGFVELKTPGVYYSERRALGFLESQ